MLLEVDRLQAGYLKKQVLFDISLSVAEGEIVSLIGHNGAGKSTLLKSIFGLVSPSGGRISYESRDVTALPPAGKLESGIFNIPQENFLFNDQTVQDNLQLSFFTIKDQSEFGSRLEEVYGYFPVLRERRSQLAGTLSGGERRMLGIGMGLLRHPKLLMLDEPSSGLSPVMFQNVVDIVRRINQSAGMAVLLVEQNVKAAFNLSKRVYVMKAGAIIMEETGEAMLARGDWWDLF